RWRKALGGGMRQAGILAAAGLYALEHHVERLAEDHENAAALATGLRAIGLAVEEPQTNILFIDIPESEVAGLSCHLAGRHTLARDAVCASSIPAAEGDLWTSYICSS